MQSDVQVGDDAITGELKYVTGYTGFSGSVAEQSGNYLVLHCESDEDATITVELIGGTHGPVTLDDDGIIILRIANTSQKVKVTASVEGKDDRVKTYSLSGLTLDAEV